MSGRKLEEIRLHMKNLPVIGGSVQAYIVPTDDQHQSEYISAHDGRRAYICGFTGSAGTAVVMETEARLWTDGRYWQQADLELEQGWNLMRDGLSTTLSIGKYLAKHLPTGSRVGVDPLMMSYRAWNTIKTDLAANDCSLFSVRTNLVDKVWIDQPKQTNNKTIGLDLRYSGESIEAKVDKIRNEMKERDSSAMISTALDEIACKYRGNVNETKFLTLNQNDHCDYNYHSLILFQLLSRVPQRSWIRYSLQSRLLRLPDHHHGSNHTIRQRSTTA